MSEYNLGPNVLQPESLNPQVIAEIGNNINKIFDGIRPPEEFLKQQFYTLSTELRDGHEVPLDCSYMYSTNKCVATVHSSFDTAAVYWTDNILVENLNSPTQPLHPYRYVEAQYVNSKDKTFRYWMAQDEPGAEWCLISAIQEFTDQSSINAQLPEEVMASAEQSFLRLKEMVSVALAAAPDSATLQTGKDVGQKPSGGKVPYLPSGIEHNTAYQAVSDLFTPRVDGAQNHWDRPDFFRVVAEAGLVLENIRLEEVTETASRRTTTSVTSYQFAPETQSITVTTEDGRMLQLNTRCYRGEFPSMYTNQREPIRYTDRIHVAVNALNHIDKILDFYIVTPETEVSE